MLIFLIAMYLAGIRRSTVAFSAYIVSFIYARPLRQDSSGANGSIWRIVTPRNARSRQELQQNAIIPREQLTIIGSCN